jgi:hypothetical protein
LKLEIFYSLREARAVIGAWRDHDNRVRPHSSLGYRPPAPVTRAFANHLPTSPTMQSSHKTRFKIPVRSIAALDQLLNLRTQGGVPTRVSFVWIEPLGKRAALENFYAVSLMKGGQDNFILSYINR